MSASHDAGRIVASRFFFEQDAYWSRFVMNERLYFVRAILAMPANLTPRRVLADWLEERGFPDHAFWLRYGCHLIDKTCGVVEPGLGPLDMNSEATLLNRRKGGRGLWPIAYEAAVRGIILTDGSTIYDWLHAKDRRAWAAQFLLGCGIISKAEDYKLKREYGWNYFPFVQNSLKVVGPLLDTDWYSTAAAIFAKVRLPRGSPVPPEVLPGAELGPADRKPTRRS